MMKLLYLLSKFPSFSVTSEEVESVIMFVLWRNNSSGLFTGVHHGFKELHIIIKVNKISKISNEYYIQLIIKEWKCWKYFDWHKIRCQDISDSCYSGRNPERKQIGGHNRHLSSIRNSSQSIYSYWLIREINPIRMRCEA